MPNPPLDLYGNVQRETLEGRALEAAVIERAAQRLQAARDALAQGDDSALIEALKFNQRLWSFFQAELESEDNPMPAALKRDLIALIEFIDRRTFLILGDASPAPERIDVLININRNIAAGLRETAEKQEGA